MPIIIRKSVGTTEIPRSTYTFYLATTAACLLLIQMASLQMRIRDLEANAALMNPTTGSDLNNNNNNNNNKMNQWQPKTSTYACPGKGKEIPETVFQSQFQEDRTLLKWFGNLCNGTYMEMGALDGKTKSNSYAFYAGGLGWRGFLLEASPTNYPKLQSNRPNDLALVHAGVCSQARDLHFVDGIGAASGGFLEFASEEHKRTYFTPEAIANAQIVQCQPLGELISRYMGDYIHFDFYSLDIEGAEYAALQTINFDKVSFGIIFVEASGDNPIKDTAVETLLESKGYRHLQFDHFLPKNIKYPSDWFINKDWHTIYADVIYNNNE